MTADEVDVSAAIADAMAAYQAGPEHKAFMQQEVARAVWSCLERLSGMDSSAASWAAYGWLMDAESGLPFRSLLDAHAREDARFWAETAQPHELEFYGLAAIEKLRGSPFGTKQIKRLIGGLWRRMSPTEKQDFLVWAERFEAGNTSGEA